VPRSSSPAALILLAAVVSRRVVTIYRVRGGKR
jgi:hypothetical protein